MYYISESALGQADGLEAAWRRGLEAAGEKSPCWPARWVARRSAKLAFALYDLWTQRKAARKLPLQARASRLPVVCFPGLPQCPTVRKAVFEILASARSCLCRVHFAGFQSISFWLAAAPNPRLQAACLPQRTLRYVIHHFRIEQAWRRSAYQPSDPCRSLPLPPPAAARRRLRAARRRRGRQAPQSIWTPISGVWEP